jgi:TolB protein
VGVVLLTAATAGAQVTVYGTEGFKKADLSTGGFRATGAQATIFLKTLKQDLQRSGWFRVAEGAGGALVLTGSAAESRGRVTASCRVMQAGARSFLDRRYADEGDGARRLAHRVADDIVWAVKRVPGIASTRIVMVGSRNGSKDLYVCDADGGTLQQLTRRKAPCLGPSWSPDGRSIVYTSWHAGFPDVYRITFAEGQSGRYDFKRVAGFPGLNAGAAIAPDGRRMALALSKDGNADLYVMSLGTSRLTRLTRTRGGAEASPSWSPDGRRLVYVSNTTGLPQLYAVGSGGGRAKRISFRGRENVAPDWGSDGRIVFCSRREGRYHICVLDPKTGKETQLTSGNANHEDPSWAPDGRHIVCTRVERYRSSVYILDTLGDPPIRLTRLAGDWYSPAWSPRQR